LIKVVGSTSLLAVGFEYSVIGNLTKFIEESMKKQNYCAK
jgi:hypothetical protein